jgi:hypothetical protein
MAITGIILLINRLIGVVVTVVSYITYYLKAAILLLDVLERQLSRK